MSVRSALFNKKIGFYDNLYTTPIDTYKIVYNPYSYKEQLVIQKHVYGVLRRILTGKHTYLDCVRLIRKQLPQMDTKAVCAMLEDLHAYDLLSFENKANRLHYNPAIKGRKLVFWVDITNQCNFRCTYCFVDKKKEVIDPAKFEKLLVSLEKLRGTYRYTKLNFILAGGEPLLYFETLQRIVLLIKQFRKRLKNKVLMDINIISNGTLIARRQAVFFKNQGVRLNISLDGLGYYNDITRKFIGTKKGTFPYILRGIKLAKSYGLLDNIVTTVTSKNIHHLPELARYLVKEETNFQFQFYKESSSFCAEAPTKLDDRAVNSYLKAIKTVYKLYETNDKKGGLPASAAFDMQNIPSFLSERGCSAGNMYFTVTQNCDIKVCPSSEIKIPYDKAFDFIASVKKLNAKFINYSVEDNPECKKCLWKYICKGGCRMEMLKFGRFGDLPPRCSFFKKMIPLTIRLKSKRIIRNSIIAFSKNG